MERERNRTRVVMMRVSPAEYGLIERATRTSNCQSVSDFMRHNILKTATDLVARELEMSNEEDRLG